MGSTKSKRECGVNCALTLSSSLSVTAKRGNRAERAEQSSRPRKGSEGGGKSVEMERRNGTRVSRFVLFLLRTVFFVF
jgi:hypothetical protein